MINAHAREEPVDDHFVKRSCTTLHLTTLFILLHQFSSIHPGTSLAGNSMMHYSAWKERCCSLSTWRRDCTRKAWIIHNQLSQPWCYAHVPWNQASEDCEMDRIIQAQDDIQVIFMMLRPCSSKSSIWTLFEMNWMIQAQDVIQVIFCEQALKALSYVRLASYSESMPMLQQPAAPIKSRLGRDSRGNVATLWTNIYRKSANVNFPSRFPSVMQSKDLPPQRILSYSFIILYLLYLDSTDSAAASSGTPFGLLLPSFGRLLCITQMKMIILPSIGCRCSSPFDINKTLDNPNKHGTEALGRSRNQPAKAFGWAAAQGITLPYDNFTLRRISRCSSWRLTYIFHIL